MVWAIDREHVLNYLLPRDCPRVTYYANANSSLADIEKFIGPCGAKHIIAIESIWLPQIQQQHLFRYEFSSDAFELYDKNAGYYISRQPVKPLAEIPLTDVLSELFQYDVELRVMNSLWELREAVIHSSLSFSIIRMKNAQRPPGGIEQYHPLP